MIGVILNPRSGLVAREGVKGIRDTILKALPRARIHILQQHEDVGPICRELVTEGATCIAAAGGDGTVSSIAAQLVGTETPLGVIPAGTLNHFARDVGVGRNVEEALRVLAHGYVLPVDVARVNERTFLNNSSIGLYPRMVEIRERYERRLGKWRAMIYAGWLVARRAHASSVSLSDGTATHRLRTYLLFVGNNQYELDLLHLGQRARLDGGQLCCFVLEVPSRWRLVPHVFQYLRERHPEEHLFRSLCVSELTVTMGTRDILNVAADGEVFRLTAPLTYRVEPRALRVVVPEPPPPESREARDAP